MTADVDLKDLERRAYRSFFNDGLYDIWFALLAGAMASHWVVKDLDVARGGVWSRVAGYGLLGLSVLVAAGGKRLITVPRIGAVRFGRDRQRNVARAVGVTGAVVAASFGLLAVVGTRAMLLLGGPAVPLGDIAIAGLVVVVFCAIGSLLDWRRLCSYGVLLAGAVVSAPALALHTRIPAATAFGPAVCVPLIIGVVVLMRFLGTYDPAPKEVL